MNAALPPQEGDRSSLLPGRAVTCSDRALGDIFMNSIHQSGEQEREPHERFQATFRSAPVAMAICDLDGMIAEVNPEFSRMLGYAAEELTNANIFRMRPLCCELKISRHGNSVSGVRPGLEISSPEKEFRADWRAGRQPSFDREQPCQRKDGSEIWGHLTVSLGRDPGRRPTFLIAMLADVTEQRNVEEHLREAEKMEAIGRMAGGIAHDFNNLLTGILLYCDLITANIENGKRDEPERDSEASDGPLDGPMNDQPASQLSKHIDEVRMAGEQGAALTHQLLAIARKQATVRVPVAINELVMSTTNLLRRLIGKQIELHTVLDPQAGLVLADPGRLRQVLINLVLNARDAMPNGGSIVLSSRLGNFPPDYGVPRGEMKQANRPAMALAVTDNGAGMDEDTRSHLFEAFFTTKPLGMGTGLGLATVHRIVGESGGLISVSSSPGEGSCFEIFLPPFVIDSPGEYFEEADIVHRQEMLMVGVSESRAGESGARDSGRSLQELAQSSARNSTRAHGAKQVPLPSINLVRVNRHDSALRCQKPRGDRHV